MRPSQAGLEVMHVSVSEGLQSIVADGGIGDDASGRVEAVHVETEEEAVASGGLVIQARGEHPIIALSGPDAEIGIQRVDHVRHLLQIDRIGVVGRRVAAGDGQGAVRRGERRAGRNAEVGGQESRQGRRARG